MARRLIEEFREEVERTRLSHPGVERHGCSLEKTGFLVEERLSEALGHVRDDASVFVNQLLCGDQAHGGLKGRDLDGPGVSDGAGDETMTHLRLGRQLARCGRNAAAWRPSTDEKVRTRLSPMRPFCHQIGAPASLLEERAVVRVSWTARA